MRLGGDSLKQREKHCFHLQCAAYFWSWVIKSCSRTEKEFFLLSFKTSTLPSFIFQQNFFCTNFDDNKSEADDSSDPRLTTHKHTDAQARGAMCLHTKVTQCQQADHSGRDHRDRPHTQRPMVSAPIALLDTGERTPDDLWPSYFILRTCRAVNYIISGQGTF